MTFCRLALTKLRDTRDPLETLWSAFTIIRKVTDPSYKTILSPFRCLKIEYLAQKTGRVWWGTSALKCLFKAVVVMYFVVWAMWKRLCGHVSNWWTSGQSCSVVVLYKCFQLLSVQSPPIFTYYVSSILDNKVGVSSFWPLNITKFGHLVVMGLVVVTWYGAVGFQGTDALLVFPSHGVPVFFLAPLQTCIHD